MYELQTAFGNMPLPASGLLLRTHDNLEKANAGLFGHLADMRLSWHLPMRPIRSRRSYFFFLGGGGLISAILRRQSASVSCGPVTNVPLTFVEYQPDVTPRRIDSSVLT